MNVSEVLAEQAKEADFVALIVQWTAIVCGTVAFGIGLVVLSNWSKTAGRGWMVRVACTFVAVFIAWYLSEIAVNDWIKQHGIADESTIVFLQSVVRLVTLIAGGLAIRMALRKGDSTVERRSQ